MIGRTRRITNVANFFLFSIADSQLCYMAKGVLAELFAVLDKSILKIQLELRISNCSYNKFVCDISE